MLTTDLPKIQPHDLEAERAILGAVLLDSTALARAQEVVTGQDFYDSGHRFILDAMAEVAGRSGHIDLITVGNQLTCNKRLETVGGTSALAELLTTVGTAGNIAYHAKIVRDYATRRKLIRFAASVSQGAYDPGPTDELLQQAERELFQISSGRNDGAWSSLAEISEDTVAYVDEMSKRSGDVLGITSGLRSIDSLLGGAQRSDLIIAAARPSMGKTSLGLGWGLAAANAGYTVGLISLEMSRRQLGLRLHGMGAPIDVHALRSGKLSPEGWYRLADVAHHLTSLPFWIDDSAVMSVEQVGAKARHLKMVRGLDLLILDYLQLLNLPYAESRQQGIAEASRKLKLLAKELDIPVIVLSQLSRECEKRPDSRPMLSDLRDSGAIEQDADVVIFIYREEAYRPDTEEKGIAEILVRKHRNGPIGDRRLRFVEQYAKFEELPAE
jgi:replicative DNA helicase